MASQPHELLPSFLNDRAWHATRRWQVTLAGTHGGWEVHTAFEDRFARALRCAKGKAARIQIVPTGEPISSDWTWHLQFQEKRPAPAGIRIGAVTQEGGVAWGARDMDEYAEHLGGGLWRAYAPTAVFEGHLGWVFEIRQSEIEQSEDDTPPALVAMRATGPDPDKWDAPTYTRGVENRVAALEEQMANLKATPAPSVPSPKPARSLLLVGSPANRNYEVSGHDKRCEEEFKKNAPDNWSLDFHYKVSDGNPKTESHLSVGATDAVAQGYDMVCRALSGNAKGYRMRHWARLWDRGVLHVGPHGDNEHTRRGAPSTLMPGWLTVGAASTSYGPGLEVCGPGDKQSYASAYVAGVMAWLYEEEGSWWDARARLRGMAGEEWTEERGFGVVDPSAEGEATLQPPLDVTVSGRWAPKSTVKWINFETSNWAETVALSGEGEVVFSTTDSEAEVSKKRGREQRLTLHSRGEDGALSKGVALTIPKRS